MRSISIVIPARNEAETIGRLLDDLRGVTENISAWEWELLVVDDHSTDGTGDTAREHGARVVRNEFRPGKGRALRFGFKEARGEYLVMMDADYSHRAEDMPLFLEAINQDQVGLVIGSRGLGGSAEFTLVRTLGNVFLTAILNSFFKLKLTDSLNGYKMFRREVFDRFDYHAKTFEIEIEIIANALRAGYGVVEVPAHERARAGGRAKSKPIRHGTRFLLQILKEGLKWRLRRR